MRILLAFMALLLSSSTFAAGLEAGDNPVGYTPKHLTGPDKGTKECPPCKYAAGPFIQIFVNTDTAENVAALSTKLEATLKANEKYHGVVVMMDETRKLEVEKWAAEWKLEKTALCVLSTSFKSTVTNAYKLGSGKNVIVISDKKKAIASFENVDAADFEKITSQLKDAK